MKHKGAFLFLLSLLFFSVISAAISAQNSGALTAEQLGKMLLKENYSGISQGYNEYYASGPTSTTTKGGYHPGIDYKARTPLPVYSPINGVVGSIDPKGTGYGRVAVRVDGTSDYFIFLHLSQPNVKPAQRVSAGDIIGITGSTGAPAAHLHVELRTGKDLAAWYFRSQSDTGVNKDPSSVINSTQANRTDPSRKTVGQSIKDGILGGLKGTVGTKPTPTSTPPPTSTPTSTPIPPRTSTRSDPRGAQQGELTRPLALKILSEQLAQPHINVLVFNDNGIRRAKQDGIIEDNHSYPLGYRFTAKGLRMVQAFIKDNVIYFNGNDARCGLKSPIGERVVEVTGIAQSQMPGVSLVEYTAEYLLPSEMQQIKAYCYSGGKTQAFFRKYDDGWRIVKQ